MSHSDSEVKSAKDKFRKTLHIEFKRKKKHTELDRLMRIRFCPIIDELRLLEAVSLNDTERVERLLKRGMNPNVTDLQSRSVLHIAVSRGYVETVKVLLEHGADPNKKDVLQNTPLHLAACTYNMPIITLLIRHGADMNSVDMCGRNPLQLARSKFLILHKNWKEGCMEESSFKSEVQQVFAMLLAIWSRKQRPAITHIPTSVDDLQLMKLSLNDGDEIDCEMSKLLSELQGFTIS